MPFNETMLRGLLKMVPQSVIDGVPELIVSAVRKKLDKVQHTGATMPVIVIIPDLSDTTDCVIGVGSIPTDLDIDIPDHYSGKEFVKSLLKEVDHA